MGLLLLLPDEMTQRKKKKKKPIRLLLLCTAIRSNGRRSSPSAHFLIRHYYHLLLLAGAALWWWWWWWFLSTCVPPSLPSSTIFIFPFKLERKRKGINSRAHSRGNQLFFKLTSFTQWPRCNYVCRVLRKKAGGRDDDDDDRFNTQTAATNKKGGTGIMNQVVTCFVPPLFFLKFNSWGTAFVIHQTAKLNAIMGQYNQGKKKKKRKSYDAMENIQVWVERSFCSCRVTRYRVDEQLLVWIYWVIGVLSLSLSVRVHVQPQLLCTYIQQQLASVVFLLSLVIFIGFWQQ